jgi:septum formation protein
LASTSPRRRDLLAAEGVELTVVGSGLDDAAEAGLALEAGGRGLDVAAVVQRLALAKLLATLPAATAGQPALAADTAVELDGAMIGKAQHREEAKAILTRLRGRRHAIHTGIALADRTGRLHVDVATSYVTVFAFSPAALEAYLDTGAWAGKAGAYGVQDAASAALVARVEGSRSNVLGLPVERVLELLEVRA